MHVRMELICMLASIHTEKVCSKGVTQYVCSEGICMYGSVSSTEMNQLFLTYIDSDMPGKLWYVSMYVC